MTKNINWLEVRNKAKSSKFWLIGGIKIGIVLIPFTFLILGPFGITVSVFPKAVFFRTLVEIIFILYLLLIFFKPEYRPKISLLVVITSIFVGVLLLSALTGINFHRSFFGELHRAEGVILHIHLLAFFLILISVFKRKEDWFNLFKIILIVSAISSLAGILQKLDIFHFYGIDRPERISGTLTNPVFFGTFLVLVLFLGLLVLVVEKKKILKILWFLILALNFSALILSGTRAAWVGTGVGLVFLLSFWFFGYSNFQQKTRKVILLGTLFLLIFALFIVLNQDKFSLSENFLFQRMMSVFDINSLSARLPAWKIALRAWWEKPILGWGPESFTFLYDKFFKGSYLQQIPENLYFDRTHNTILGLMATTGILGTLSYLSIFFVLFYLLFKYNGFQKNKEQTKPLCGLILASFLVAYLVQNLFAFDTISTYIIFFLILGFVNNNFKRKSPAIILAIISVSRQKALEGKKFSQKFLSIFLVFSYISFSLITFYQVNFKPTKASLIIIQGMEAGKKDLNAAFPYYRKGISQKTIYDEDFRIEIAEGLLTVFGEEWAKNVQTEMLKTFASLKPSLEEKLEKPNKTPPNFYEILFRIDEKIYLATTDPRLLGDMEEVSKKALEFNNQNPRFYQLAGKVKILQKDYQAGEAFYQKAFELTPGRPEDKIKFYNGLGSAYFRGNNKLKAADNFKKAFDVYYFFKKFAALSTYINISAVSAKKIALMYYEIGDFATCCQIYERAIEIYPKDQEWLQSHLDILIEIEQEKEK